MSKDNFNLNLKNLNNKTKRSKSKDSDGINLKENTEEKIFKTNKSSKTTLKKINELAKAMDGKETRISMLELKAKQQEEKWEALAIGLKKQQVMNQILLTNLKKTMETQKITADLPSFNKKDIEKNNYFFLKKNNYLINNLIEAYEKNVLENNLNSNLNLNLNLNSENNLAPNFNDSNSNSNANLSLTEGMPGAGDSGSKSKISIEGDEEDNKDVIGDEWLDFIDETRLKNNVYNNKIGLVLKEKLDSMKREIENKWWLTISEIFQNSINQINAIPNQFNINNKNLQNIINTHCETIINNNINIKEIENMVKENLKKYEENLRIENEKHMKFNKNIQEKLDMIDENIKNNTISFNNKINEINQQKQGLIDVQKTIEERYSQLINENKFRNIESDVNKIKNLIEKAEETSRTKFIEFENNFQRNQINITANNDKINNLKLDIQNFNIKYEWLNNQINNMRTELSIRNSNNNNNIFTTQRRGLENNNNFNNNQTNSNTILINNENNFYSKSEINNVLINYAKKQEWKNDIEEIKNSINDIKIILGNQKMELNKEINTKIDEIKIEEEIFKKNISELKTWKLQNTVKLDDMNIIIENLEIEIKNFKKNNNKITKEEIINIIKNQTSRMNMNMENILDQKIQEKINKEIEENYIRLKKLVNIEINKEIKNTIGESNIQLNLIKDNKEAIEEKKIIWSNKENKNDIISKIRIEVENKMEEIKLGIEENKKKIDIKFKKELDQIINEKITNLKEEIDNQKKKLILIEKNCEEIANNWEQNVENLKKVRKECNEIKIKIQNENTLEEKETIWINKIKEINNYTEQINSNIEVLQEKIRLIEKDNTAIKEEFKLFKKTPKIPADKKINRNKKQGEVEEKNYNNNEEEEEEEEDNNFNRNLRDIKMNIFENNKGDINNKKENNIGTCNEYNCEFCIMIKSQLESFIQDYLNHVDNVDKKIHALFKDCKDDIKRIENKITEYQFKTLNEKEKIYNETYKIRDVERLNMKIMIKEEIGKFIKENNKTMDNLTKQEWYPNENIIFKAKNIKELDAKLKNEFYNKNKLKVHTLLKKGLEGINNRMEEFWKEIYARERPSEKNNQSQKKKGFEFYLKYQKKFLKNKYIEQLKKNEKNYNNRNRSKKPKVKEEWEKIIENGNELVLFMNGFKETDDPLKKKINLIWDKENNELIIKDEENNFMDKYCSICLKKHDVSNSCPDAIFLKNQNNLDWNRKESKENICMICGKPHCCWMIQKNGDIKNIFKCSLLRKWIVICSIGNIEYKIMEKKYIISDEIDWKLKWNMFEKIIMARFEKEYLFQTINNNIWLKNGNLNKLEQEIKKQKIKNFKFDANNIKLREIFKKVFNMTVQIDATNPLKIFWNDKNFKEKKIINGKLVQSMIKNFILNKIILKIIDLIGKNKEITTTPITNNDKMEIFMESDYKL